MSGSWPGMPEPCRRLQSKHHREHSRRRASHLGLAVAEMLNRKDMFRAIPWAIEG